MVKMPLDRTGKLLSQKWRKSYLVGSDHHVKTIMMNELFYTNFEKNILANSKKNFNFKWLNSTLNYWLFIELLVQSLTWPTKIRLEIWRSLFKNNDFFTKLLTKTIQTFWIGLVKVVWLLFSNRGKLIYTCSFSFIELIIP